MAATTAMCSSFKSELMRASHNLGNAGASPIGGNAFKLILIKTSMAGTYGAASTNYSNVTGNSDEAASTESPQGYLAGGIALTNNGVTLSGTTAFADFADITITNTNLAAAAAMIINSTLSNAALSVHDFGGDKTASGGNFVITFPVADASNAILRLA